MVRLHPKLTQPVAFRRWVKGTEHPQRLYDRLPENSQEMARLTDHHVVSARQFKRETLTELCRLAAYYECTPSLMQRPLQDRIMISAFHEPSTRTRISFESAWNRLGGIVMSITDPNTTGIAKGESIEDVAEMFSNYGDVMVLRDNNEQTIYKMLDHLRIPIINAGNGVDEHPTQALADLYTIFKWRPELAQGEGSIKVGIIGTPNRMRTVRSLLLFLGLIQDVVEEVVIINPSDDIFDVGQLEELDAMGLKVSHSRELNKVLPELDVVYINAIAWVGETYEVMEGDLSLSSKSPLKPSAIVLHPLARGEELDVSLDDTNHNWYFSQARGAVFIRMALLTIVTGRAHLVQNVDHNDFANLSLNS